MGGKRKKEQSVIVILFTIQSHKEKEKKIKKLRFAFNK